MERWMISCQPVAPPPGDSVAASLRSAAPLLRLAAARLAVGTLKTLSRAHFLLKRLLNVLDL